MQRIEPTTAETGLRFPHTIPVDLEVVPEFVDGHAVRARRRTQRQQAHPLQTLGPARPPDRTDDLHQPHRNAPPYAEAAAFSARALSVTTRPSARTTA